VTNIPSACRIAIIALKDAMILPYDANPGRMEFSERTGKLVMGILALIAEFENDIRRERQMDGIAKAKERGVKFGRKPILVAETVKQVRKLRKAGKTVPEIMRQTSLSKASVYRALSE
jgi:DNA invertase Pin-like site-specific DNA recombinase